MDLRDFGQQGGLLELPILQIIVAPKAMGSLSARAGFVDDRASRKRWWQKEYDDLERDIRALGHANGRTGNAYADAQIAEWCPSLFRNA